MVWNVLIKQEPVVANLVSMAKSVQIAIVCGQDGILTLAVAKAAAMGATRPELDHTGSHSKEKVNHVPGQIKKLQAVLGGVVLDNFIVQTKKNVYFLVGNAIMIMIVVINKMNRHATNIVPLNTQAGTPMVEATWFTSTVIDLTVVAMTRSLKCFIYSDLEAV